jgi:PAS domain S-box-containing protein
VSQDHYLKHELYALVKQDSKIFEFLQAGSLDGVWYWDLKNQDQEWMSPRFWRVFGFDPNTKKDSPSEWQGIIHPQDAEEAMRLVKAHLEDESFPYDQIIRYTHADGHTVWIRCRGIAIRNELGEPVRMLGAHTDITELKEAKIKLEEANRVLEEKIAAYEKSPNVTGDIIIDLAQELRQVIGD